MAAYIAEKGYNAFSQSDENLIAEGKFDAAHKESLLPNKTIALLAGLGWIGKNNLLITPEYGAAQCLGTVLTDAPLETFLCETLHPHCGKVHCLWSISAREKFLKVRFGAPLFQEMKSSMYMDAAPA